MTACRMVRVVSAEINEDCFKSPARKLSCTKNTDVNPLTACLTALLIELRLIITNLKVPNDELYEKHECLLPDYMQNGARSFC